MDALRLGVENTEGQVEYITKGNRKTFEGNKYPHCLNFISGFLVFTYAKHISNHIISMCIITEY